MNQYLEAIANSYMTHVIVRLILASMFGALIGIEREYAHRPAGLRTHLLVCVGSCLVMLTSEYVYSKYHYYSPNMDVTRLGAQVISGIGFLGAGTIIRNGNSIKGLTTAASIWAVACVGLATGIGYYAGATIATIIIFLVLAYFKSFMSIAYKHDESQELILKLNYSPELINTIKDKISEKDITINNIKFKSDKDDISIVTIYISENQNINLVSVIQEIYNIPGVHEIEQKKEE